MLEASRSQALTAAGATLQTAQAEGRHLAGVLAVLALLAAVAPLVLQLAERRVRLPQRAGTVLIAAAVAAAGMVAAGALIAAGGPVTVVERAVDSFTEPLPAGEGDLRRRLLSVSGHGRGDYWLVAWRMARDEPLHGTGAGSFEARWLRERPTSFYARDAHNLYLETLAELGVAGLALLVATIALPLAGLTRVRRVSLAPAAALFCAATLLAAPRSALLTGRGRVAVPALAAPVLAIALVAHVGNRAAAASIAALERGEPVPTLAQARRAIDWAPWSDEPWQLRGEAELLLERDAAARRSFRRALELNPESWRTWLDLAVASRGAARTQALTRVRRLNPLSQEADELQTEP